MPSTSQPSHPSAPGLPAGLLESQPGPWELHGSGLLRWSLLRIYEARLYLNVRTRQTALDDMGAFAAASPFVLDITYLRNLSARDIILATHQEIVRLRPAIDLVKVDEWCVELEAILPDVLRQDRLSGHFVPNESVTFYWNGELVGRIASGPFCEAFAAIWLDPATRQPALRAALLGQS